MLLLDKLLTVYHVLCLNPILTGEGPLRPNNPTFFKVAKKLCFKTLCDFKTYDSPFYEKNCDAFAISVGFTFFSIGFQIFCFALYVVKDFFSKTCKTPKTAENRGTIKTKVVELGIIFHMHAFKI